MKTRRCREEKGRLNLENELDRIMKELGAVALISGYKNRNPDYVVDYRYSVYFLESRNIAVKISCYLGTRHPEYTINFYGPDEEIGKLEQSLENEIGLIEKDKKVREEEEQKKGVLHRPFGHYEGSHYQFCIR